MHVYVYEYVQATNNKVNRALLSIFCIVKIKIVGNNINNEKTLKNVVV